MPTAPSPSLHPRCPALSQDQRTDQVTRWPARPPSGEKRTLVGFWPLGSANDTHPVLSSPAEIAFMKSRSCVWHGPFETNAGAAGPPAESSEKSPVAELS